MFSILALFHCLMKQKNSKNPFRYFFIQIDLNEDDDHLTRTLQDTEMFLLTLNLPDLESKKLAGADLFSVQRVSRMLGIRSGRYHDIRDTARYGGHQEPDSDHIIRDGRRVIINRALSYKLYA